MRSYDTVSILYSIYCYYYVIIRAEKRNSSSFLVFEPRVEVAPLGMCTNVQILNA